MALKKQLIYQSPVIFMTIFFVFLAAWTIICFLLLGSIQFGWDWSLARGFMIVFIMLYTWYFSLAISHKVSLSSDGSLELTSFRRTIHAKAQEIDIVEGPKWALLKYGFIRFRLEREKGYLYACISDQEIQEILKSMKELNEYVVFKGL